MLTATDVSNGLTSEEVMLVPPHIRRIVLTGFMGAGKSTIGKQLASQLGWKFVDVDAELEAMHACTIADLFVRHQEEGFRRLESSAIVRALGYNQAVIALGGGAIETLTNRLLLEQTPGTYTIFLDAPFGELFDRCMLQPNAAVRPNLADPIAAQARYERRLPLYRRAAKLIVETKGQTPDQTIEKLMRLLVVKR